MKNTRWYDITNAFRPNVLTESRVTLGNSIELPALFRRLGWRLLSACMPNRVKFTGRLRQLMLFSVFLIRMAKHHGGTYTVKYLKSCQLAIQKRIAGNPFKSLSELEPDLPLPRLSSCGLPAVIPRADRRLILAGSPSVIRWWLTLFSVYRIISIPGKLKIETITSPLTVPLASVHRVASDISNLMVRLPSIRGIKVTDRDPRLLFLEKSSPCHSLSWLGSLVVPSILASHGLEPAFKRLIASLYSTRLATLWDLSRSVAERLRVRGAGWKSQLAAVEGLDLPPVGQLQTKEEAAGKVRVFAMVDVWTQSVMSPIHKALFAFLEALPNDATFDQGAAVRRCLQKSEAAGRSFGYDLSAATDRLPIQVQVAILSNIIGKVAADAWAEILVGRSYVLLSTPEKKGEPVFATEMKYAVGQPMGALSSWAMLAVTHHLIVQLAAYRAGLRTSLVSSVDLEWYSNYELLGDDIVIFDETVASQYLTIMKDELGVEINLSKSVVASNATFEFAKVTGHRGQDVSALSWKMFVSQNTFMGRANISYFLLNKGIVAASVVRWLRALNKRSRYTQGDWNIPLLAIFTMFANSGKVAWTDVLRSLLDLKNPVRAFYKSIVLNARVELIQSIILAVVRQVAGPSPKGQRLDAIWNVEEPWLRLSIWRPIQLFLGKFGVEGYREFVIVEQTNKICDLLFLPVTVPGHLRTLEFPLNATENEQEMWAVWVHLYWEVKDQLDRRLAQFDAWDRRAIDAPFETLFEWRDSMDRINEFLELPNRSVEKLSKVAPQRKMEDSPLALVSLLTRVRGRPKWTKRAAAYETPKKLGVERVSVYRFFDGQ